MSPSTSAGASLPQPREGPAVQARSLRKRFGPVMALDGVDLEVPAGCVYGLIGPNGAGKTTLMRLLLDLLRPTSGQLTVLGRQPELAGPALRRLIGYLPGDLRLDGRQRGRDLLAWYSQLGGPADPAAAAALAERLGVDLNRRVRTLSKGNRQKVGLIQAFMHRPPLLVLDEPTSGLDPLVQQEFLAMVREARDAGQTVFLSSHMISEVEQVADTVAILRNGTVVTAERTETIRAAAARRLRVAVPPAGAPMLRQRLARVRGLDVTAAPPDGRAPAVRGEPAGSVRVEGRFDGEVADLINALAGLPVLDVVIEEPDLEEAVLRFYDHAGAGRPGGSRPDGGSPGGGGSAPEPQGPPRGRKDPA